MYIPVIAGGDPATPESHDVIQCRARGVLRRYVDATSSTPFCNCHDGHDCLNPFNFQILRVHCETDYIDSNLPDDSGDGVE